MSINECSIGDEIKLYDKVHDDIYHYCTIKFIEEEEDGKYIYLIALDHKLNIHDDPRFDWNYYCVIHESEFEQYCKK